MVRAGWYSGVGGYYVCVAQSERLPITAVCATKPLIVSNSVSTTRPPTLFLPDPSLLRCFAPCTRSARCGPDRPWPSRSPLQPRRPRKEGLLTVSTISTILTSTSPVVALMDSLWVRKALRRRPRFRLLPFPRVAALSLSPTRLVRSWRRGCVCVVCVLCVCVCVCMRHMDSVVWTLCFTPEYTRITLITPNRQDRQTLLGLD